MAILAVVLFHAGVPGMGGGYVGVDVFFVVSGFLITGLLWGELERTGRIHLGSFYARRARRLLPAAAVVLVATVVAAAILLPPLRVGAVAKDAQAAALYVGNYRFALSQMDYLASHASPSPLLHFWSLGIEEQFYLFWPLILLAASSAWRRTRRPSATCAAAVLAVLTVASLVACIRLTDSAQPWAFFSLPTRAWELGVGALVALAPLGIHRFPHAVRAAVGWAGLAAIVWSVTQFGATTPFPGVAALLPVVGTAAVLLAGSGARPSGPAVAVLGRRPMQAAGRISYSWYLWHWPALVLAAAVAGEALSLPVNLALVAASAVAAAVTVHVVENPIRFSTWLAARPARTLGLGTVLTSATLVAVAVSLALLPSARGERPAAVHLSGAAADQQRPPPEPSPAEELAAARAAATAPIVAALDQQVSVSEVPSDLEPGLSRARRDRAQPFLDGCHTGFLEVGLGECVYGVESSPVTVMLFGDSHATQWSPALEALALQRGWRLEVLAKSTCPPMPITSIWSPDIGRIYRECDAWRDAVLERIRAERPALVVLGVARHYGPEFEFEVFGDRWLSGLSQVVREVNGSGSRVAVLGPIPKPPHDVVECLSENLTTTATCTGPPSELLVHTGITAERSAVLDAGGHYVDVAPWFCTASLCPPIVGNLLVYRDDNHVTTRYASWVAPALGVELDALVGPP